MTQSPGQSPGQEAAAVATVSAPADDNAAISKTIVTVEVCQLGPSQASTAEVIIEVERFLQFSKRWYDVAGQLDFSSSAWLQEHVEHLSVSSNGQDTEALFFWQVVPDVLVYKLRTDGCAEDDEGEDGVPSFVEWELPNREFHTLWETLIYETNIQARLVSHATTSLMFSQRGVNPHLIAWNKVVLLHGPPGTGKTSLCKAIAQKVTIRLNKWYKVGHLIEVNAHSLFSKWFSESGKLVTKLFTKIMEFVEESDELVFVLMDEVESLTAARRSAAGGGEPSDAIRAVNSLLTHVDALKAHANVMVLCTSNLPEAVDAAFVDRADIKAYIGPPGPAARYEILRSCISELLRTGIVSALSTGGALLPWRDIPAEVGSGSVGTSGDARMDDGSSEAAAPTPPAESDATEAVVCSQLLRQATLACDGLSGRTLRKLPFLAHAAGAATTSTSCQAFLRSLIAATDQEMRDRELLGAP